MAKIHTITKLNVEDFPAEYKDLITKFANVLNPFFDQVSTALSQKLTYDDNFKSKVYSFVLPAGSSTLVVAWEFNEKPKSVYLGNLTLSTGQAPASAFCLSSYHSDKKINLTFLGLNSSYSHNVTVIAQI